MPRSLEIPPTANERLDSLSAYHRTTPMVALAQEIGILDLPNELSIESIAARENVTERAAEAMLVSLAAHGLLESTGHQHYRVSTEAKYFFAQGSPYYRGPVLPVDHPDFLRTKHAFYKATPIKPFAVDIASLPPTEIESFIARMHAITLPAAPILGRQPIFTHMQRLLDVGGGSASLSIGIAEQNPNIKCSVLDLEPVCVIAKRNIDDYGMQSRIDTINANMFKDPWPSGYDGILFGNIFHDWDVESCVQLATKAFEALAPGGFICLHEILLNADKTGPLLAAGMTVAMLVHELGKQFTFQELRTLLVEAGFTNVTTSPSFGAYSLVTAQRPG